MMEGRRGRLTATSWAHPKRAELSLRALTIHRSFLCEYSDVGGKDVGVGAFIEHYHLSMDFHGGYHRLPIQLLCVAVFGTVIAILMERNANLRTSQEQPRDTIALIRHMH